MSSSGCITTGEHGSPRHYDISIEVSSFSQCVTCSRRAEKAYTTAVDFVNSLLMMISQDILYLRLHCAVPPFDETTVYFCNVNGEGLHSRVFFLQQPVT